MRYRTATVMALVGIAVAVAAAPAFAHVEVSADKTQAGATDVTLTFNGEAENPKAGIKSERVVLPTGIAPADVSLVKAPTGWTFARNGDGFMVGGRALSTGTDARWSVKVAKLPADQTRLSFKTVETYGDGEISRWIEIQEPGQPEPDNPAPLLVLKPAAAAPPASASAAPVSPSAAPATLAQPAGASGPAVDAGAHPAQPLWWLWPAGIALIVAGAGWVYFRRRAERSARDSAPR